MKLLAWYQNPIFRREMLTRWRHPTSFLLVVAYALAIAAAVWWQVLSAPRNDINTARLGHDIWQTLTITQILGWILLGPALTAGAIASEREKGHLDALLLSPLSASEIVNGKMLGALSLASLLLLVPLPAIALCFLLGGVSPGEFLSSLVLQFGTALSGMSFGLVASAHSRNNGHAIVQALFRGLCAQAVMVAFCCLPISPLIAMNSVGSVQETSQWISLIFLAIHFFIARRQLHNAMQAVAKPLPEVPRSTDMLETATPLDVLNTLPATMTEAATETARQMPAPRLAWLNFSNPVLQREAQARFRFKWSGSRSTNDVIVSLTVIGFFIYVLPLTLMAWFEPDRSKELWWMLSYPWLLCTVIAAALTASATFTSEREGGHWPLLWLTPLPHRDIIGGKVGGVLLGLVYWSLWMLPFWIPCFFHLPFSTIAITFLLSLSAIWLAANIGLCLSALCKKSGTALNWTLIALLIWWFLYPPWQNWQTISLPFAFLHAMLLFSLGELLYAVTHRILHRAPYED